MEDDRVSYEKLLMARSNKRHQKIYGKFQYMLENEEQDKGPSRKVDGKQSI